MDKYRSETRARKRRTNAKIATIVIVGAIVLFLLLEWQEFAHLSSQVFHFGR